MTSTRTAPGWHYGVALAALALTWPLGEWAEGPWRSLWPSLLALFLVWWLRRVIVALIVGGLAGALLLEGGNAWAAGERMAVDYLLPSLTNGWRVGSILFTLLLGGFAALLEAGGGMQALLASFLRGKGRAGVHPGKRLQGAAMGLGLVCFFDGLANSLLVGRVTRSLAVSCGVSGVKMAYITDATSSAVACVAFFSTWIAFQLSLIAEGLAAAGREGSAYPLFFASIPVNFYCLFTLGLLGLAIVYGWNPGPMGAAEREARAAASGAGGGRPGGEGEGEGPEAAAGRGPVGKGWGESGGVWRALAPLGALVGGIVAGFVGFHALETGQEPSFWPERLAEAFSTGFGAEAMVVGTAAGLAVAWVCFPHGKGEEGRAWRAFAGGVQALLAPVLVLVAAWTLSGALQDLGTAQQVAGLLQAGLPYALLPALVFLTGNLISFTTGTSWGTMGILMPLALPLVFLLGESGSAGPAEMERMMVLVIAAVFSGAVFGDHCSPFSDTTIVSSIACGVETLDHVRTQMPYALAAAGTALVLGFIPAGFGVPGWLCLAAGGGFLWLLARRGSR